MSVLWGSVGCVARSAHLGVPYCAHPVRRRFLRQTPFTKVPDALTDNMPAPHRQAGLIMERLIQAKPGVALIDKLIDLFEIKGTSLAARVKEHLRPTLLSPA